MLRISRKRSPLNAKKARLTPKPTAALPKLMLFGSSSMSKAEKASSMPRLTATHIRQVLFRNILPLNVEEAA